MWDTRYFAKGQLGVLTVEHEMVAHRHIINDHIQDLPTAKAILAVGRTKNGHATMSRTDVSLSKPRHDDRTNNDRQHENQNKRKRTQMGGPENAISAELTTMRAAMSADLIRDHQPALANCLD